MVGWFGILMVSPSMNVVVMSFTPISSTTPTTTTTSSSFYTTTQQKLHYAPGIDTKKTNHPYTSSSSSSFSTTTTSLYDTATPSMMSPWNLNPEFGAPPFGFDVNAEVWNGRIAQVRYIDTSIQ
jgi:hypothetical protein